MISNHLRANKETRDFAIRKFRIGENIYGRQHHPLVNISWLDSAAICEWVSQKNGRNGLLPNEAEWVKAARGTDGKTKPWGNQTPDETR